MPNLRAAFAAALLLAVGCFSPAVASKCYGLDPCGACKTCSSCMHCAQAGGTCGVCKSEKQRYALPSTSSAELKDESEVEFFQVEPPRNNSSSVMPKEKNTNVESREKSSAASFSPGSWFVGKIYDGVTAPTKLLKKRSGASTQFSSTNSYSIPSSSSYSSASQSQFEQSASPPQNQFSQFPFDPYTGKPNPNFQQGIGTDRQILGDGEPLNQQTEPAAQGLSPYPINNSNFYPNYSSGYSSGYSAGSSGSKMQHVNGYYTKNGHFVQPYYRRARSR